MTFKLKRPCAKCPFRTDVPSYLRGPRAASIARDLAEGSIFHCHETTVEVDDDLVPGEESQFCAGALLVMDREDFDNQAVRMARRLGLYDPANLDGLAPVHDSLAEFVRHHDDEDAEDRTCSIVGPGCEAPAGYLIGGVVVPGEGGDVTDCPGCGQPVCDACSDDEGLCDYCADERGSQ